VDDYALSGRGRFAAVCKSLIAPPMPIVFVLSAAARLVEGMSRGKWPLGRTPERTLFCGDSRTWTASVWPPPVPRGRATVCFFKDEAEAPGLPRSQLSRRCSAVIDWIPSTRCC